MQIFFRIFGQMMVSPWLALVPAVLFYLAFERTKSKLALTTSVLWLLYCAYEFGMKQRWLCTGECNIRVDLILIYPVLFFLSIAAIVSTVRIARRPRR